MATDLNEQLERIGRKTELLLTRYEVLLKQARELRSALAEREATIAAQKKELEQARIRIEHLEVASTIVPTRESLSQTRAYISDLVREIDACVDDLIRDV